MRANRLFTSALAALVGWVSASGCGDDHLDTIRVCGLSTLGRPLCGADVCGALGIEYEATVIENVDQNPGFVYCSGSSCSRNMELEERARASHEAWEQGLPRFADDCFRFVGGRAWEAAGWSDFVSHPVPADVGAMDERQGDTIVNPHFLRVDAVILQVCWRAEPGDRPPCRDTTGYTIRRAQLGSQAAKNHVLDVTVAF